MAPKFCAAFRPRTRAQQLEAIGLQGRGGAQLARGDRLPEALCRCLDPSDGHWEDIEPPQQHEWLDAMLEKTPDQSFRDFVASRPHLPEKSRRTIYLQPLCDPGDLEQASYPVGPWPSWAVLEEAVRRFYRPLRVVTLPAVAMASLEPRPSCRKNAYGQQWNATEVLDAISRRLPRDAYCTLAVTMCDLFPRPEWNFVYGLARLTGRVGVFSFVRHTPRDVVGKSTAWLEAQLLHRALKTMIHEIGHMFGLRHCTYFNCLMRGSNGEEVEHQTNYLHLCPVCLRKLHHSIGFDVVAQYASLLELFQPFEEANELFKRDCEFLRKRLTALSDLPPGATAASGASAASAATLAGAAAHRGPAAAAPARTPRSAGARDGSRREDARAGAPPVPAIAAQRRTTGRQTCTPDTTAQRPRRAASAAALVAAAAAVPRRCGSPFRDVGRHVADGSLVQWKVK